MLALFSGRHVGVPWRYANMAGPYRALKIWAKYIDKYLNFGRTYRPKTWRSALFIYLLSHENFLTWYTESFLIFFQITWQFNPRIRGCATVLITGQYIVLEHIRAEYYTVRKASSSVSSNQGHGLLSRAGEPLAFSEIQRKAIAHCPHSKGVEIRDASRRALSYGIVRGRKTLKTNACACACAVRCALCASAFPSPR